MQEAQSQAACGGTSPTELETALGGNLQAGQSSDPHSGGQDDALLVARTLAGDHDAYHLLVERYVGAITALAYAMVSDRESARDVAQEAFSEGYRLLGALRAPEKFGAWICGIARRRGIYYLRQRKRSRLILATARESGTADRRPSPAEHLERKEVRARVLDALAKLSDKYRTVLMLKYVEGMTYERIAATLEIRVATVDKRLTRAKAMLRKLLKDL
jgi:RNA polymerase sigma-70 factor (ECF subfamily)